MIDTLYASTLEIDDADFAVEEILGQLDQGALKKHSVGIIGCNLDYITNGTIEALCAKLPFDVVGNTTTISDKCGDADEDQLSLLVLTSDSVSFATGASGPLSEPVEGGIDRLYREVEAGLQGSASLAIVFAPLMLEVSADSQLRALNRAGDGVPVFGAIALDYVHAIRDPRTIHNGKDYRDRMSLLLVSGAVEPLFFMESISEERIHEQKAVVTSSENNVIKEVNRMPAVQYMETLGLAKDGQINDVPLVPLSIDLGDGGRPTARAIFAVTPDGSVICGGDVPENSTLGVGSVDADDVRNTAIKLAGDIVGSGNRHAALIFSCVGRNRALGLDPMHEIEQIRTVLGDEMPYLFLYSGGELYPDMIQGKASNKALNDSIIACVF